MNSHRAILFAFAAGLGLTATVVPQAAHAAPASVSFTARIQDANGPVNGEVDLTFALYALPSGGASVWKEQQSVQVDDGLVYASLGDQDPSGNPLDETIFDGAPLYLDVTVNGDHMGSRIPVLSVPYAIRATTADKLGDHDPSDFALSTHDHDGDYLPMGANLTCASGQKVTGLSAGGDVSCGPDQDTTYTAAVGGGLSLSSGAFSVAAGGITSTYLAANAVDSSKVLDGTLTAADLAANACGAAQVATNAIDSNKVVDGSLTAADLAANACGSSEIATNAVDGSKVLDDSLTSADIAANAVGASELAANAVDGSKVLDDSLTANDLAASSVGASEIATDAVGASEIATDAVGSAEIAASAVGASEIADNAFGWTYWDASRSNTAGTTTQTMTATANSFCALAKVSVEETDTGGESATCDIGISGSYFVLQAILGASSDADIGCQAYCISW